MSSSTDFSALFDSNRPMSSREIALLQGDFAQRMAIEPRNSSDTAPKKTTWTPSRARSAHTLCRTGCALKKESVNCSFTSDGGTFIKVVEETPANLRSDKDYVELELMNAVFINAVVDRASSFTAQLEDACRAHISDTNTVTLGEDLNHGDHVAVCYTELKHVSLKDTTSKGSTSALKEAGGVIAAFLTLYTEAAIAYGIAHNDMHLNNVVYDRETNRLKLIDFGRMVIASYEDFAIEETNSLIEKARGEFPYSYRALQNAQLPNLGWCENPTKGDPYPCVGDVAKFTMDILKTVQSMPLRGVQFFKNNGAVVNFSTDGSPSDLDDLESEATSTLESLTGIDKIALVGAFCLACYALRRRKGDPPDGSFHITKNSMMFTVEPIQVGKMLDPPSRVAIRRVCEIACAQATSDVGKHGGGDGTTQRVLAPSSRPQTFRRAARGVTRPAFTRHVAWTSSQRTAAEILSEIFPTSIGEAYVRRGANRVEYGGGRAGFGSCVNAILVSASAAACTLAAMIASVWSASRW
jgi:hypothetical protein